MMLQLCKIRDALTSIDGLSVTHYWRPKLKPPYCLWAEDGEADSLHTNNRKSRQVITGTIDYYTLNDFDENIEKIQNVLNEIETCGWMLNSVQYEDETNLIHYEWRWEIA